MSITSRIDAITHLPASRLRPVLEAPKSVKIELTGRCNFRCSFCATSDKKRVRKDMDWGFFKKITREMRGAGVEELGLFYLGESFMVDWLEEACRYAKRELRYPYVFLTTNGSLATPERVGDLMANGLDSLKFSLNYSGPEQFKQIARVKEKYFHAMINNIKNAYRIRKAIGSECGLYASYIEYTDGQVGEMQPIIDELTPYLDQIYALPCYNQSGFVTEREKAMGMAPTVGNRGRAGNLTAPIPCWALFSEGHITYDGKLSGCCFGHTPDFDFGDLNELFFMEAWNSERAQWFRSKHLAHQITDTPCKDCFHL